MRFIDAGMLSMKPVVDALSNGVNFSRSDNCDIPSPNANGDVLLNASPAQALVGVRTSGVCGTRFIALKPSIRLLS